MEPFLLYRDHALQDFKPYTSYPDMVKDLNLTMILKNMSAGDAQMQDALNHVIATPVTMEETLEYRKEIQKDLSEHPDGLEELFTLAKESEVLIRKKKREESQDRGQNTSSSSRILSSLSFAEELTNAYIFLREILQKHGFRAEGLVDLKRRLEEYPLDDLKEILYDMGFYSTGGEALFQIRLSGGFKLEQSTMKQVKRKKAEVRPNAKPSQMKRLFYKIAKKDTILVEDEELEKDLYSFIEANMKVVRQMLEPWIQESKKFFQHFYEEMAYYKGISQFKQRMKELYLHLCDGTYREEELHLEELYDLSLALYTQTMPVTNDLTLNGENFVLITGANQGGKSTFLRSFGIAQVLFQCGIPVPCQTFEGRFYDRIHTHFTRKEDVTLSSGRLEEELKRMSKILDNLTPDSLVLLNESFASTTEKEGAGIAEEIILPMFEKGIHIWMVTHLYEFANKRYEEQDKGIRFLIAGRRSDGKRTFKMIPGKPHYSSYGTDLYEEMIGKIGKDIPLE